ncbi:MAG: sugar ABC transporter substrate-binding protein [Limnochordaceae bacterium]|nr:sugar ABC transporter substrate-binding protein [Limnochordaceae bacterium]
MVHAQREGFWPWGWSRRAVAAAIGIAAATVVATGPAQAASKVTIRYQYWGGAPEIAIVEQVVNQFMKEHPNIEVKAENVPYPGYSERTTALIAAGTAPDVLNVPVQMFAQLAAQGAFHDLGQLAKQDKSFDLEEYILPARMVFTYNGKLEALPREFGPMMMFYGKQMFDEKGLPYPDADWTWDTFLSDAQKLTRDLDGDGKIDRFFFAGSSWIDVYLPFLWGAGGDILDKSGKYAVVDQPAAVKGLQFYADLFLKYHVSPTLAESSSRVNVTDWFTRNQIAVYPTFRAGTTVFLKQKGFDFDVAPFPKGPGGYATIVEPVGVAITTQTTGDKLEAAWEFAKYMTGPVGVTIMTEQNLIVPAIVSVAKSNAFITPNVPPAHDLAFIQMQPYARVVPMVPQWPTLSQLLGAQMNAVLQGQETVSNAMKKAAEQMNQALVKQR